ncbi:MAG: choice-of-anchor tandem repeat GloVer-containing protein, partial [Opitutaceae bacterium]
MSYDSDPATGVSVYLTGSGWAQVGGTSMAAPQWTALSALTNSLRQQPVNSAPGAFYTLATSPSSPNYPTYFHDITSGSNGAYSTSPGYDRVTGLGSPIGDNLVLALAGGFSSQVAAPVFFPGAGAYSSGSTQSVSIVSATAGVTIRYTTDGSVPTDVNGVLYSAPIQINTAASFEAIAYKSGLIDSSVTGASYTFVPQVAAPTFSPAAGTYTVVQTVTISTTTSGAAIGYTTDGSTPTESGGSVVNGTLYSGPVSIGSTSITTGLRAIAFKSGFINSPVTSSGTYTVIPVTPVNVLYNFTGSNDGDLPSSRLTKGSDGNFYSTTAAGGVGQGGTVFKVTPAGVLTTLISFSSADANTAQEGLVQGSDGNFYGTTWYGGNNYAPPETFGYGTVFKITSAGVLTFLDLFTGVDGAYPVDALVQGSDGDFYGTTSGIASAASNFNDGTVFKMTPAGILTTLVSFSGANGDHPFHAGLVQGRDGNFYGTTNQGGGTYVSADNPGDGTVFKMTPAGVLTTLVSFDGANGASPDATLVQGSDGDLYGTTFGGGNNGDGTVFKMTPAGVLTTLVSFTGANGAFPEAALVQGSDGNFYGTTIEGGSYDDGAIFRMTPAGGLTLLASFDIHNGELPEGALVQGSDGNFYGTTISGGTSGAGVIYQLRVAAAPTFSPAAGSYASAQTVTISTPTSGASIRYTTDGSTPTETNGMLYFGPVSIATTTTLQAIAFEPVFADSAVASGAYTISNGSVTVSSSNGFDNIPMSSAQSGTFTATFDAWPSLFPSNAVIALSKGSQTAYTGLSCIARFNTSGDIDAYNGTSGYQAAAVIPFTKGLTYHFRIVVNVPANTYSVYVTPPGGSELLVGSNYGFRKAATSLDTWTIDVNSTPGGSVTVSNLTVVGTQQVTTPTFSPAAGTYTSAQSVTISTATSGAS